MFKKKTKSSLVNALNGVIKKHRLLTFGIVFSVVGAVAAALLPPLVLERIVNLLTAGAGVPFAAALSYFALVALTNILDALRESLLIVFGQKITHGLRSILCGKLSALPAGAFARQEPGAVVSRFVGDVDTVESLFTSGIISMFADGCKIISIFAVLFVKNRGLALVLLLLVPILFIFTRAVQKRMLAAQMENRAAVGKATNHVPETIRCIRTIHLLRRENYMRDVYDRYIQEGYEAVKKTNFYDAVYSPVILTVNALVVGTVMLLSAAGVPQIQSFFGMSVGTAAAVITYIGLVFAPLESIGMEIQTIQSAVAGVRRINEFLSMEERGEMDDDVDLQEMVNRDCACIELRDVTFGYDSDAAVLNHLEFTVKAGEQVTLTGRTGAGKSTVFKLLLGQYRPDSGKVLVYGRDASRLPDGIKRRCFGYAEQRFRMVPGSVLDQITLFDESISREMAEKAAKTTGLHSTIVKLKQGYDTPCTSSLFSQGQWQLLSIARAIAAEPKILLLDEITANLDAETEQTVLQALKKAVENRTVISISHRLYRQMGGRQIALGQRGRSAV